MSSHGEQKQLQLCLGHVLRQTGGLLANSARNNADFEVGERLRVDNDALLGRVDGNAFAPAGCKRVRQRRRPVDRFDLRVASK